MLLPRKNWALSTFFNRREETFRLISLPPSPASRTACIPYISSRVARSFTPLPNNLSFVARSFIPLSLPVSNSLFSTLTFPSLAASLTLVSLQFDLLSGATLAPCNFQLEFHGLNGFAERCYTPFVSLRFRGKRRGKIHAENVRARASMA